MSAGGADHPSLWVLADDRAGTRVQAIAVAEALAVPFTNDGTNFGDQIIGIASIGAFVVVASSAVWFVLKAVMGLRPTVEERGALG